MAWSFRLSCDDGAFSVLLLWLLKFDDWDDEEGDRVS